MLEARPVRVRALIERPPPAPGCTVPFAERVEWWDGRMLAWRWVDRDQRLWTALVEYSREGLLYHHWLSGDLVET